MKRSGSTFSQTIIKSILFGARNAKKSQVASKHSADRRENAVSDLFGVKGEGCPSQKHKRIVGIQSLIKLIGKVLVPMNCSLHSSALRPCLLILPTIIIFGASSPASAISLNLTVPDSGFTVSNMTPISSSTTLYGESTKNNVTIKTDAAWGYTLNIKAKDGATNTLKTTDNNTLNSITSASSDYKTNTTTNLNTWAFLPGKLNSAENSTYQPGPKADLLLGKTSGANSEPEAYPLSIAAKVDGNQASGTYKNTWAITATANTVNYSITYNLNGGDSGSGPSNVSSTSTTEKTITLQNKTPTRANYDFKGWCTSNPGTSETCSGSTYQPGNTYTLSSGTNTINLYAIWKATGPPPLKNLGNLNTTMQNFNCDTKLPTINNYGTVKDSRDNNTYTVARLLDNKCWMVENLRIAGKTVSSTDSDMSSGSLSIPNRASGFTGTNNNAGYYYSAQNSGYYSWYTATAGTGTSSVSSGNVSSSICPKGWKLPTGGSNGEFSSLSKAYGGTGNNENNPTVNTALRATLVPGFVFSGDYGTSSFYNGGNAGYWWSSTAGSSTSAYAMHIVGSFVYPTLDFSSGLGFTVRCVKR